MAKTMKWFHCLFCRKPPVSAANTIGSKQDININSQSAENESEQAQTERSDCLRVATEETGKGRLSSFKITVGEGDSHLYGPPVCLTEMLANDELFQVLEGRQFLLCTEILVDGVTDEQSMQLHGKIPVTVRRTVRDDGKRIKEMRMKGTLKWKNRPKNQQDAVENYTAATQTNHGPPHKLQAAISYHGFTESNNALNEQKKSRKKINKRLSLKISTDLKSEFVEPSCTDISEKWTDIDLINRSDDVNLLLKNDHKTRINYTTSLTTSASEVKVKRPKRRPRVKKSKSCTKIKCPVTTITVTRSHTRFIKYDDGFECMEKLGTESVCLNMPCGLYFTKENASDETDPSNDHIVRKTFSNSKLADSKIFDIKAPQNENNPLVNSLHWLYKNVASSEGDDSENSKLLSE